MYKELKILKPDLAEARGRNGWFVPRNIEMTNENQNHRFFLYINSCRQGRNSPVTLCLDQSDADQIACAILEIDAEAVRMVQKPEGEEIAMAVWGCEDVQWQARQDKKCLTLEQCNTVLKWVNRHWDSEYGISWNDLRDGIDELEKENTLPACIQEDADTNDLPCNKCPNFKKGGEPCPKS
jgi:hypothetical protein